MKLKLYQCTGENFKNGYKVGYCGDVKTIRNWIISLFGEDKKHFFENDTDREIINYIYKNTGKKLESFN